MRYIKLIIWEIAERWKIERFIPNHWGYLGPTKESYKPKSAPYIFK